VPILEELRPQAFAVAYRMLGSVSEAEDIVQEALPRLHLTLQQGERIEPSWRTRCPWRSWCCSRA
jgi:DNA-directed RNA polymerase specialized sigma24 family protein